jgi:WD40 repeat protein
MKAKLCATVIVALLAARPVMADEPPDTSRHPFKFERVKAAANDRKGERKAISPDKKVRVELSLYGDTALLYDVGTGKPFGERFDVRPWHFTCCTFSPDGKNVVTGSRFDDEQTYDHEGPTHIGEIQVWDAATGKEVRTIHYRGGPIKWIAFKADGRTIEFDDEPYKSNGK